MSPSLRALGLLALLAVPAAVSAQQAAPPGLRAVQLADLVRERDMTLAMLDSMPVALLEYKPTAEVRNFAQQIAHAAVPVSVFAARAKGEAPPAVGDSLVYLKDKAALRVTVEKSYAYALDALRGLTEAQYAAQGSLARRPMPAWKMFDLAHEHSVWTRGELVSYFRLNGMAPPAFDLFGPVPGN